MAKRRYQPTPGSIQRRIKDGRGQGTGADYKPWLTIRDVPSLGLVHRVKGLISGRTHHLMSRLEAVYFYIMDMSLIVIDIQEQYPLLPQEETLNLARSCGVPHPSVLSKTKPRKKLPIVMTTDFVITVQALPYPIKLARTVKPSEELNKERTLAKFEIERRYWLKRGIDWKIVTEKEIPVQLATNLELLRNYVDISDRLIEDFERLPEITSILTTLAQQNLGQTLRDLGHACDQWCKLPPGISLTVVYHLLATRQWPADLTVPLASAAVGEILQFKGEYDVSA